MNLAATVQDLLFAVSQFAGVTLPRVVFALVGLLLLVAVVVGRWERSIRAAPALLLSILGVLLLSMALDPRVLHALVATTFLTRIRILLGLLSAFVVVVTFEAIRRSRLQERYALLWMGTGAMVLLLALMPRLLDLFRDLLGVQYVTAVVAVVFAFLLMVCFHFSLSLSGLEEDRSRLAQRLALLEIRLADLESGGGAASSDSVVRVPSVLLHGVSVAQSPRASSGRAVPGAVAACIGLISVAVAAVFLVGMRCPQPMIGDEVTHYYMLTTQAEILPTPNYRAKIPVGWSTDPEIRFYPHPNGWHYLGAALFRLMGRRFWIVQAYHALFLFQLLLVAFLWIRARRGVVSKAAFLYVLVLATVPMNLLFSVAFYQDVPMAAQALTAFYLLDRRRYLLASFFMAVALWVKVTGVVFLPPFLILLAVRVIGEFRRLDGPARISRRSLLRGPTAACGGLMLLGGMFLFNSIALDRHASSSYYPVQQIQSSIRTLQGRLRPAPPSGSSMPDPPRPADEKPPETVPIIANHPGDLRIKSNYVLYGGMLIWALLLTGLLGLVRPRGPTITAGASRRHAWPIAVGLFYLLVTAWQLRTAPDARFFLPALPFLLLPLSEWTARLPKYRWILTIFAALGVFQGYQVLVKAVHLREVAPALTSAIRFLETNPPSPPRVFMYPEGNYRLFPVPHDWYLGYRLREFWRADNTERIEMLNHRRIGAVVLKKHLVAEVDEAMTNLGVYPRGFVRDLRSDDRFVREFENDHIAIFGIPRGNGAEP